MTLCCSSGRLCSLHFSSEVIYFIIASNGYNSCNGSTSVCESGVRTLSSVSLEEHEDKDLYTFDRKQNLTFWTQICYLFLYTPDQLQCLTVALGKKTVIKVHLE